jgi:hypothetical protein
MDKIIDDLLKIQSLEGVNKEDQRKIEEYIKELNEKFKFLKKLQNTVLNDSKKLENFTSLISKYVDEKNG